MTKSLGVQSESVELDIWKRREDRRVISEQSCKRQKHLAGKENRRLKEIVPALKLFSGLYNSNRPEVISRLMRGQLNFLPLRSGSHFPPLVLISRNERQTQICGFSAESLRLHTACVKRLCRERR